MKLSLTVLSLLCCGCLASPIDVEQSKVAKRSISDGWSGGYIGSYGLSSAALATPSISTISLGAPAITSHTHTHSTAVIDRPYAVPIHTPTYSASILPSISATSILPSYNYGLSSYNFGSPYGYGSLGYGGKYLASDFGRYYSRSYPSIYRKSYYSSPSLRSKWWWFESISFIWSLSYEIVFVPIVYVNKTSFPTKTIKSANKI